MVRKASNPLVVREIRDPEALWVVIPILGVLLAVALLALRQHLGSPIEYLRGQVLVTEGIVTKHVEVSQDHEQASTTASYYYRVNERLFSVNQAGYEALIEGRRYRLYFLPKNKKLVNIEVIRDEAPTSA
jgi:hypothetical protein